MPLISGRWLQASDDSASAAVILINETAARTYFGEDDPVGKPLALMGEMREVVGVMGDVREKGPAAQAFPTAFIPYDQTRASWLHRREMSFTARTAGDPGAFAAQLREAAWRAQPALSVRQVRTMNALYGDRTRAERFRTVVLATFASLATLLSLVGVGAVVAYAARQRAREFGIRKAVGATSGDLATLVLRHSARLAVLGTGFGALLWVAVARGIAPFLFETSPLDATVLLGVVGLLGAASIGGSLIPARQAAGADPAVTLKED